MALKKIIGLFSLFVVSVSFAQQQHYSMWEKIKRGLGTARDVSYGAVLRKTGIRFVTPAQVDAALEKPRDFDRFIRKYGKDVTVTKGVIARFEEGGTPLLGYTIESSHKNAEALALKLIEKGAKPTGILFDAYVSAIKRESIPILTALRAKRHKISGNAFAETLKKGNKAIKEQVIAQLKKTGGLTDSPDYLHAAIRVGDKDMVVFLLDEGATVNLPDNFGYTALNRAAGGGNDEIVSLLLQRGAKPNLKNRDGDTPLHAARTARIAQLLLENGAVVDAVNERGNTALFERVRSLDGELIAALRDAGASTTRTGRNGDSLLQIHLDHPEIARYILATLPVNINNQNNYGNTALHQAARDGKSNLVQQLLQKKATVNIANRKGITPLALAAKAGKNDIVQILLQHGANVHAIDVNGNTVLHYALSTKPDEGVVATLIQAGAAIDRVNREGRSPMHYAARTGNYQLFTTMLGSRLYDINLKDNSGNTVLHYAVMVPTDNLMSYVIGKPNENLVRYLIGKNAIPDILNDERKTVFHLAVEAKSPEVLRTLLGSYLSYDVDIQDSRGNTPLHKAIINRDLESAALLVKKGASVNTQNRLGDTPLHEAGSDEQLVGFLMQRGANPAVQNKKGVWTRKYEETRAAIQRHQDEQQRRAREAQAQFTPAPSAPPIDVPPYSPESFEVPPPYSPDSFPAPSAPPL